VYVCVCICMICLEAFAQHGLGTY